MSAEGSLFVIRSGTAGKYLNSHPLIQPSPFRKLWRCDIRGTAINESILHSTLFPPPLCMAHKYMCTAQSVFCRKTLKSACSGPLPGSADPVAQTFGVAAFPPMAIFYFGVGTWAAGPTPNFFPPCSGRGQEKRYAFHRLNWVTPWNHSNVSASGISIISIGSIGSIINSGSIGGMGR